MSKAITAVKDAALAFVDWVDRHPAWASAVIVVLTITNAWALVV